MTLSSWSALVAVEGEQSQVLKPSRLSGRYVASTPLSLLPPCQHQFQAICLAPVPLALPFQVFVRGGALANPPPTTTSGKPSLTREVQEKPLWHLEFIAPAQTHLSRCLCVLRFPHLECQLLRQGSCLCPLAPPTARSTRPAHTP